MSTSLEAEAGAEALIERVVASTIGLFDLAGIYSGAARPVPSVERRRAGEQRELAERTGTDERYVREWLEQQAVTGLLTVDDVSAGATSAATRCRAAYAEALVDADSPSYIAPLARQALGMLRPLPQLVEAFRPARASPIPTTETDTRRASRS